jgi:hypothetical protein
MLTESMTTSLTERLTHAYSAHPHPNRIKALVLTNPHNPLSRCYPPSLLRQCMSWCHKRGIHLVSDEMYALSTIASLDGSMKEGTHSFVSALRIAGIKKDDLSCNVTPGEIIEDVDYSKIHVVWGMSKDFGSSGIRMVRFQDCSLAHATMHSIVVLPNSRMPTNFTDYQQYCPLIRLKESATQLLIADIFTRVAL